MRVNQYSDKEDELVDILAEMGMDEETIIPIVVISINEGVTSKMIEYIRKEKNITHKMVIDKLDEIAGKKYRVYNQK